jgi:hypothetical protein
MRSSPDSSPTPATLPCPPAAAAPAPDAGGERWSVVTVATQARPHDIGTFPVLKLMGDWLAAAGFRTGTFATLHASHGRIVIEAQGHLSDPHGQEQRSHLRALFRGA